MNALIIAALIFCACKLISAIHRRADQRRMERIEAEQKAQRDRDRMYNQYLREQARRAAERDKAIARAAREREALRKEQERIRKEQERHAAQLAKHEEQICKMQCQLNTATANIDYLQSHIAELDAQLDYCLLQQAGAVPGSKTFEKYQNKIVSLHSKIHAAENNLIKAQYQQAQAQRKLA